MTRANLRRFLILIWRIHAYHLNLTQPAWWMVWKSNVWAYHEIGRASCRERVWHVKLPASIFEEDRLRVNALIIAYGRPHPDKEKARRWASASRSAVVAPLTIDGS
jgi:hypothetical protein